MNRAFLIGAGATKAEYKNAPVCIGFFKNLKIVNPRLYSSFENIINQTNSISVKSLEMIDVEYLMKSVYQFPPVWKNKFLMLINRAIYDLLAKETHSRLEDINSALKRDDNKDSTLLKLLVIDGRLNDDDFFMTLNYDSYLDREVLSSVGNIDYGIDQKYLAGGHKYRAKNQILSVYHLHGSLGWINSKDDKVVVNYHAVEPKTNRTGSNLCIIPPGIKELPPVIKSIWTTAENRLLNSDELIIIGCSLAEQDLELKNMIQKFVNKKKDAKIKIICKETSVKDSLKIPQYYRNIIKKDFRYWSNGFTENTIEDILKR